MQAWEPRASREGAKREGDLIKPTPTKGREETLLTKRVKAGEVFDPIVHCGVCKAKALGYPVPHRGHHEVCSKKQKRQDVIDRAIRKANLAKLPPEQRCSFRHSDKEHGDRFFAGDIRDLTPSVIPKNMMCVSSNKSKKGEDIHASDLYKWTTELMEDETFLNAPNVKKNKAPLPMLCWKYIILFQIIQDSS